MQLRLDYSVPAKNILTLVIALPVFWFILDSLGFHFRHDLPDKLRVLIDITLEANIPTWYSSMLALLTAMLLHQEILHTKQY